MDKKAFKFSIRDMTPLVLEEDSGGTEPAGESDFSFAEVNFTVANYDDIVEQIGNNIEIEGILFNADYDIPVPVLEVSFESEGKGNFTVVLYKGQGYFQILELDATSEISCQGSIEYLSEGATFSITGDGSATFSIINSK